MSDLSRLDALFNTGITVPSNDALSSTTGVQSEKAGENFSDILKGALNKVNDAQLDLSDAVKNAISSESPDMAETMIALQKADVSLKMMLEVRNKILEAYQEVIRTQI